MQGALSLEFRQAEPLQLFYGTELLYVCTAQNEELGGFVRAEITL